MSEFLNISIVRNDLTRLLRALDRVESQVKIQQKQLPYLAAIDYKHLLVKNILTQKFASQYQPYHPKYAEWKTQTMLKGSMFWRLYGDVLKNITIFPATNGYMSGLPAGVFDSGGKSLGSTPNKERGKRKYIAMYATVMEKGLNNHPQRAVFGPTKDEYYQTGFVLRGSESLTKIGAYWR